MGDGRIKGISVNINFAVYQALALVLAERVSLTSDPSEQTCVGSVRLPSEG